MNHFASMCFYSTLNTQVLFYDVHGIHFDDIALNIIQRHHMYYFILKEGDYLYDQPKDNGPNTKFTNFMLMKE